LDDLAPRMLEKLAGLESNQIPQLLELLRDVIRERHFMAYSLHSEIQELIDKYNFAGRLYQTKGDYLMVNHSNIGGFKTDGVMDNSVTLETNISSQGGVVNTLTVSREHQGGDFSFDGWNQENINYMRFYLPKGASIISADGFEDREEVQLDERSIRYRRDAVLTALETTENQLEEYNLSQFIESDKTVFAGWVTTKPKEKSQVTIQYQLPEKIIKDDLYTFIFQKQPGIVEQNFQHIINYPESWNIKWETSSIELDKDEENRLQYQDMIRDDQYIGLRFR